MKNRTGDTDRLPAHGRGEAEAILAQERTRSDTHLAHERQLIDATLSGSDPADPQKMVGLRDRIRRIRGRFDRMRTRERRATDDALQDRQTVEDEFAAAAVSISKAAIHREEEAAVARTDSAKTLWLILAELDVIACAIDTIRFCSSERRPVDPLFAAANEAEVATGRVLELAGAMLDPEDHRGLFHEIGGSG